MIVNGDASIRPAHRSTAHGPDDLLHHAVQRLPLRRRGDLHDVPAGRRPTASGCPAPTATPTTSSAAPSPSAPSPTSTPPSATDNRHWPGAETSVDRRRRTGPSPRPARPAGSSSRSCPARTSRSTLDRPRARTTTSRSTATSRPPSTSSASDDPPSSAGTSAAARGRRRPRCRSTRPRSRDPDQAEPARRPAVRAADLRAADLRAAGSMRRGSMRRGSTRRGSTPRGSTRPTPTSRARVRPVVPGRLLGAPRTRRCWPSRTNTGTTAEDVSASTGNTHGFFYVRVQGHGDQVFDAAHARSR